MAAVLDASTLQNKEGIDPPKKNMVRSLYNKIMPKKDDKKQETTDNDKLQSAVPSRVDAKYGNIQRIYS